MRAITSRFFLKTVSIAALAVPVFVTACSSSPGPMPTGYKFENQTYSSAPDREPNSFDKTSRKAETSEIAPITESAPVTLSSGAVMVDAGSSSWREPARDLLTRMTNRFGQPTELVRIESGVNPALAQALRAEMAALGWKEAASVGQGPFTLNYTAASVDGSDAMRQLVTLQLHSVGNKVAEESGIYTVTP